MCLAVRSKYRNDAKYSFVPECLNQTFLSNVCLSFRGEVKSERRSSVSRQTDSVSCRLWLTAKDALRRNLLSSANTSCPVSQ